MRCLEAACHSFSSFFISLSNHSGMVFTTSTFQFLYFILFLVAVILTVLLSQRRRKASAIPSTSDCNTDTNEEPAEDEIQDTMVRTDIDWTAVRQPYDAYLVLDVEATCMPGTDFNYANEIIVSNILHIRAFEYGFVPRQCSLGCIFSMQTVITKRRGWEVAND